MTSPYVTSPTLETGDFVLRLVSESDAVDLLKCYSDKEAQKIFNSDKCTGDFCMYTIDDMLNCTKAWIHAYTQQEFIRFAIVHRSSSRVIGTVEMFGNIGKSRTKTGILRVDISSGYENAYCLKEIFGICKERFFSLFDVDTIATKAIPYAVERRKTLSELGFREGKGLEGDHYFICGESCGERNA